MTIDQAIKILSDSANKGAATFNDDFTRAQQLGIEALLMIRRMKTFGLISETSLLPGETEG